MSILIMMFVFFVVVSLLFNNGKEKNNYKKTKRNHLTNRLRLVKNRNKPPPTVKIIYLTVMLACMIFLVVTEGTEATVEELAKDLTVALASCILAHATE